jgi:hypothetical protein
MVALKTVCLRRLGGDRDGELRCGRFLDNNKVTVERIVESWSDLTGPAAAGRHVLAIQDTTEVVFPTTAQRRRGLGQVKKGNVHGLSVHAMIGVDADTGACLGLVGGEVWSRASAVDTPARERAFEDRESARWPRTAKRAETVLASASWTIAKAMSTRNGRRRGGRDFICSAACRRTGGWPGAGGCSPPPRLFRRWRQLRCKCRRPAPVKRGARPGSACGTAKWRYAGRCMAAIPAWRKQ